MWRSQIFWKLLLACALPVAVLGAMLLIAGEREPAVLWLGLPTGLVVLGVAALMAHWFIGPLRQIVEDAGRIADDDERPPLPVSVSRNELAELTETLEETAGRVEARLRQMRDEAGTQSIVLANMAEGVLAVDAQLRLLLANRASHRMLAIAAQGDLVGRPLLEVVRDNNVFEAAREALAARKTKEVEIEIAHPTRRRLSLRATPLPGQPCPGAVLVIHDVSELRRLENLRQEFVANVSHELKTPLASIRAYAETLRMGALSDPPQAERFLARIEDQAERLDQLIADILRLARVESGRETLHIEPVPLGEVVNDCLALFGELAQAKGVSLSLATPPEGEPPLAEYRVLADREALRVVLSNLIDNAVKYTPIGGEITIAARGEGEQVAIEVSDNGVGIAAADQERIFERFYRVDKARSRELGGTGLGLAIVKHLSKACGGEIALASQPGQGSTFTVKFPKG